MEHGRREFLAVGGGAILCTLAGHRIGADDGTVDLDALAASVPQPARAKARQLPLPAPPPAGQRREYWIAAERVRWTIVPGKRDEMMDEPVKGKTTFTAFAYRQYTANFAKPMGPATIPGPTIEAQTGDQVVVNFRNGLGGKVPVTMHPHGIQYAEAMDGSYKGKYTDPGGFVKPGATMQYVWDAIAGTEGAWLYHDHGPMDPLPVFKGLFGTLIIRKAGEKQPDVEFPTFFHDFIPSATGLPRAFSCINGRAYAGSTPTRQAKVGQDVAFYAFGVDNNFHTFHIHGHRWTNAAGKVVDNETVGPADSLTARFTEANPGRWLYHCHVFAHLGQGMSGWYIVT
ncbi:MAG: hypothetical protein JWM71_216 [Solirubrobacteraceae bacterium]|nr:hypothetical protein [Solirubrobacteraceae bacterium]